MGSGSIMKGLVGLAILAVVAVGGWFLFERYQNRLVVSEVKAALIAELGEAWQLSEFEVTVREKIGDSVQPIWKFRHSSSATLISDKFVWEGWLFGSDLLRKVAEQGEVRDLSGVGQARFTGQGWEYTLDFDRNLLVFPGEDESRITKQGVVIGDEDSDALFGQFSDESRSAFATQVGNGWVLNRFDVSGLSLSGTKTRPGWLFNYDGEVALIADRYSLFGRLFGVDVLQLEGKEGDTVSVSGEGQATAAGQTFRFEFAGNAQLPAAPGLERSAFGSDAVVLGEEGSDALFAKLSEEASTAFASQIGSGLTLGDFSVSVLEVYNSARQPDWNLKFDGQVVVAADRYKLVGRLFGVDLLRQVAKEGEVLPASGRGLAKADGQAFVYSFDAATLLSGQERGAFGPDAVVMNTPDATMLLKRFVGAAEEKFALLPPQPWTLQAFQVADFTSRDQQRNGSWPFDFTASLVLSEDTYVQREVVFGTPVLELKRSAGYELVHRRSGTATESGTGYEFAFDFDLQELSNQSGKQRDFFPADAVVLGTSEHQALLDGFKDIEASILRAVVAFYDQKGEWSGVYRIRSVLKTKLTFTSDTEVRADVEYIFECLNSGNAACSGQVDGVDKRWFLVRKGSSGNWVGERMGGHLSAEF